MRIHPALSLLALLALAGCQTAGVGTVAGLEPPETGTPDAGYALSNDPGRLGDQHFARAEYGLAEKSYQEALERTPGDVDAWLGLASSYDYLKRYDLADRAYTKARELGGPSLRYLNNRAYSLMLRGKFQEARVLLDQARRKDPENPLVQNNLQLLAEARAKYQR